MGVRDRFTQAYKALTGVDKGYTETTSRPAVMQPYMATDTGAKLPIFPFPLIMIYELSDNVDALRISIETINREMFKNSLRLLKSINIVVIIVERSLTANHLRMTPLIVKKDHQETAI